MGFSVSGATAIILLAGMIAFGIAFTAAANGFDVVSDAEDDRSDRFLDQQNSAIDVTEQSFDETEEALTVEVENTGSVALAVSDTDLLIDGTLQTDEITTTAVADDEDTELWLPGEILAFEVDRETAPDRIKVVTETGVSDLEVVDDG